MYIYLNIYPTIVNLNILNGSNFTFTFRMESPHQNFRVFVSLVASTYENKALYENICKADFYQSFHNCQTSKTRTTYIQYKLACPNKCSQASNGSKLQRRDIDPAKIKNLHRGWKKYLNLPRTQ